MHVKEFKALINRGLGSAFLFIKDNPTKAMRYFNAILYACTHKTTCDAQVEESRARYLYEIIQITPFKRELEDKFLEKVRVLRSYRAMNQCLQITKFIAESGNKDARELIYEKFNYYITKENDFFGADEIISLDKEEGLIHVVSAIGDRILNNIDLGEDEWYLNWILNFAKDELGKGTVTRLLKESRKSNSQIKAYTDSVKNYNKKEKEEREKPRPLINYNVVIGKINRYSLKKRPYSFRSLGFRLTPEERLRLAQDFEIETDKAKLVAFLFIFSGVVYPLDPRKIINLAGSNDNDLSNSAFRALSKIKHEAIHELAVENISKQNFDRFGLDLFIKNYEQNDYKLLEMVLRRDYKDYDMVFHSIGLSIINIFEENKTTNCLNSILELYKRGWCSNCRRRLIEILVLNKVLPEWMLNECKHDCNLDIRMIVKNYRV